MRNLPDFPHINNINEASDSLSGHKLVATKKESKLSKGPRNNLHGKFVKNEQLIRKEIMKAIAKRNISLRVAEVCRAAKISSPTFYLHHSDCNRAKKHYESVIIDDFLASQLTEATKLATFERLLVFVRKHSYYFGPASQACDMYVLMEILYSIKHKLVSTSTPEATYDIYAMTLIAMIRRWIIEDTLDIRYIPEHANALIRVRLMKY